MIRLAEFRGRRKRIILGSIVYLESSTSRLLVQLRRGGMLSGLVGLPGGKIEFGEDAVTAGLRELEEETKLRADDGKLLGVYSEISLRDGSPESHIVLFVVGVNRWHGKLERQNAEGTNFWATKEEIRRMKNALPDLLYVIDAVRRAPFAEHLTRYFGNGFSYVVTDGGVRYPR